MLKRIIFDLDNTLISWKEEYNEAAKKALEECNITIEDKTFSKLQRSYQENLTQISIENMTNYFNRLYNQNVDNTLIKCWLKHLGTMSEKDENLISTLSYLQQKYPALSYPHDKYIHYPMQLHLYMSPYHTGQIPVQSPALFPFHIRSRAGRYARSHLPKHPHPDCTSPFRLR